MAVLSTAGHFAGVRSEAGAEAGSCEFKNEPVGVGSFWDPTCALGMLGCLADGKNMECRLCGAGDYLTVACPPSSCKFPNEPFVSYYWDNDCEAGKLGCWADGIHAQCRFCGSEPFTSLPCPEGAAPPNSASCAFKDEPTTPYYWEPGCEMGKHGCNADGVNVHCRFCGEGVFADIPCPALQLCEFEKDPTLPYYWDPECADDVLGCKADGIHTNCRFCARRPFETVPCPGPVPKPEGVCTWPLHGEPTVPFFWEPSCKLGMLGCWADGLHAECRFCGEGDYASIVCPETATRAVDHHGERAQTREAQPVTLSRRTGDLWASFKDIPMRADVSLGAAVHYENTTYEEWYLSAAAVGYHAAFQPLLVFVFMVAS